MTVRKSAKTIAIIITIDMLALIVAATPFTAVEAQTAAATSAAVYAEPTTSTTTIGNNTTDTTSSGIDLSQQPVLQEQTRTASETQINYAHVSITYTGNGTLNLTNNNIATVANFTSNGSALVSFLTQSAQGTETIRTANGETATITFYEIVKFNPATREAKGIIIAEVQAGPTGTLASLNGMILAGTDDIHLNGQSNVTLWEWESGISNLDIFPVHEEELRNQ
jgi:lysophospholipase L1-like esterase